MNWYKLMASRLDVLKQIIQVLKQRKIACPDPIGMDRSVLLYLSDDEAELAEEIATGMGGEFYSTTPPHRKG